MTFVRDVIVVGASAGGVEAYSTLLSYLPPDLPAFIFFVQHISPHRQSELAQILARQSQLKVVFANGGEKPKKGVVYVAPPDRHLIIKKNRISLGSGPKENRVRPSVDVLFRTAAHAYGDRVIGVVLSGNLNDGTAGLYSIKTHGGYAIVQDPDEAIFPGMPESAINHVSVDKVLRLSEIASQLVACTAEDFLGKGSKESDGGAEEDVAE
jgi:two-component system chemotaxis response regulator CheB